MKVCVVCMGFKKDNISRQPWRCMYEFSKVLCENGVDLVVLSDTGSDQIGMIRIRSLKRQKSIVRSRREVLDAVGDENPDVVVQLLGLTSFLRRGYAIDRPLVGVLTSPIYTLGDLRKVGKREVLRHPGFLFPHFLGAMMPDFISRRKCSYFKCIVVLSESNRRGLEEIGVSTKVKTIPVGIDDIFLEPSNPADVDELRTRLNPEGLPIIMYYASPLTLRGTDSLVEAFGIVRKRIPSKLLILSRLERDSLVREENILKRIAEKMGVIDSVQIVSENLTPKEIRDHLSIATVICLPFKIVISDFPISVLESLAVGKPVVSTNVGCIPEMLDGRGIIIEPNDSRKLADTLVKLLENSVLRSEIAEKGKRYIESNFPRNLWEDVCMLLNNAVNNK